MRLAYVSTMGGVPWGGSEALWSEAALASLTLGHQVLVSVYDWGTPPLKIKVLREAGAEIHFRHRYDPEQSIAHKAFDFLSRKILDAAVAYRPILDFAPDHVVISQGGCFDLLIHHTALAEELIQKQIPFSLICHSHEQYGFIPGPQIYPRGKDLFTRAANIFVVSQRMAEFLQRQLCKRLSNICFTWNPLFLERLECLPWPADSTTQFSMVGSLDYRKGVDTAIECLAGAQWYQRDWKLNLYGDGYGRAYLEDLARYFKITERIHFHGQVNDIVKVWKENHLLLIPSAGEGMPISLIEACMCGRPAVATDVGGVSEIIEDPVNGFIAEAPTVSSFTSALERAWAKRSRWKILGLNAHERIKGRFTDDPALKLLEKVL